MTEKKGKRQGKMQEVILDRGLTNRLSRELRSKQRIKLRWRQSRKLMKK